MPLLTQILLLLLVLATVRLNAQTTVDDDPRTTIGLIYTNWPACARRCYDARFNDVGIFCNEPSLTIIEADRCVMRDCSATEIAETKATYQAVANACIIMYPYLATSSVPTALVSAVLTTFPLDSLPPTSAVISSSSSIPTTSSDTTTSSSSSSSSSAPSLTHTITRWWSVLVMLPILITVVFL
ncbi:hypothetical protein BC829DRAFT_409189 [Chytridium lagenaria]|nr:hypothetical protein BC829DRAFT_409189 [Chytridium lagenaria]